MRKLGMWAAVLTMAGLLASCSTAPNGGNHHTSNTTSSTAATTSTTSPTTTTTTAPEATTTTTAASPSPAAIAAAKAQWNQGACAASAVQGQYWQAAATDLQSDSPSSTTAIADLKQLITLPDMGLTTTQSNEFQSDVQYLDGFFGTPGLYSTATGNCPGT